MRWKTALVLTLIASVLTAGAGAKPVKLSMWTHHRHMADHLQQLVAEFNRTAGREKGIEISLRIIGDDAWDIFQNAQSRGEGPDLYSSGFVTGYANPFEAGVIAFFDDMPGFAGWKEQWPDWYWIEGLTTYQGRVYAVPTQVFNSRLIYNKDLFRQAGLDPERPPRSYHEVREFAKKITESGGGLAYGFAYCGADCWPLEWMPSQWAEANGDPVYWDWKNGRWAMEGYLKVFQLILDMKEDGSLFPGAATLTNDALRAHFAQGRIGMFMGEAWDIGVLTDQFPAKCDWGWLPSPPMTGTSTANPGQCCWAVSGTSTSKAATNWQPGKLSSGLPAMKSAGKCWPQRRTSILTPKSFPMWKNRCKTAALPPSPPLWTRITWPPTRTSPAGRRRRSALAPSSSRFLRKGATWRLNCGRWMRSGTGSWTCILPPMPGLAGDGTPTRNSTAGPAGSGRRRPHLYRGVLKPGLIAEWVAVAKDLFPAGH